MIRPDLNDIPAYVPGAKLDNALKLSSNEVAQSPLPSVIKALEDASRTVNRYPDMGAADLREAIAAHVGVTANEVAVGTGSSALCQQLVQITAAPGDEIIFAWRSFEAYPIFARVVGATPVPVPLLDNGHHDLDAMAEAITPKTQLIFLCTPNNPSGAVISRAYFDRFMRQVPDHVIVAVDEAYIDYNRDPEAVDGAEVVSHYDNVVSLRTFSKAYGLAGVRVGYAFGPQKIIEALNKVAIPFGVSSLAQAAAIASLECADELAKRTDETVAARARVVEALGSLPSEGNFVWLPGGNPRGVAAALAEQGVIVRAFDEGVRITVTTEQEADQLIAAWDKAGL